jgi:hypothetical protein
LSTDKKSTDRGPNRPRIRTVLYREEFPVLAYRVLRDGGCMADIAKLIGCSTSSIANWIKTRKAFRKAVEQGTREQKEGRDNLRNYIYKRLPPELQDLWDKINECEESPNSFRRIDALFEKQGLFARMHLFLYALVDNLFDMPMACRKVCVREKTVRYWIQMFPEFAELLDQIHYYKQQFCENSLMRLVEAGDTQAVIFANRCLNRDVYNEKAIAKEINVSGQVDHNHIHGIVNVDDLQLPLELRKNLLERIRNQQAITVETELAHGAPESREKENQV